MSSKKSRMYNVDTIKLSEHKKNRISFDTTDRATRRVIAPYVKIVRRGQKVAPEKEAENAKFAFYLHKKPSVLLRDLSSFLSDNVDLPSLMHETAEVVKNITRAGGVTLYMVDFASDEIYQSQKGVPVNERHKINWKIQTGTIIAAYVAAKKEYVIVDDILGDARFPSGIGYHETVKSVICVPVVTPENECFAVLQLSRDVMDKPFQKNDLKITMLVTGWMGAAVHQNQRRLALQKQQELNDYLLDLTKCYFADTVSLEKIITEIVKFAKTTLGADRGCFFIIDTDSEDLVADVFDEGIDDGELYLHKKNVKVRFTKERTIAGLVARTGVTINLKDAYNDPRFNPEIDIKTGFITRSILCMPIMSIEGMILGVIQVVNKQKGAGFTESDENLFKTFSVYCALALHYAKLHTRMNKTDKVNKINLELLYFQLQPCVHDSEFFAHTPGIDPPENFDSFSWYITPDFQIYTPQLTLYMITDLVNTSELKMDALKQFILTVKKAYRNNPFHNWEHAFNVAHCMYNILKRNLDIFTAMELKALMISALCHDVDHSGYTNYFIQITQDTKAQLYEDSPMEHHHFRVTMTILSGCPIFAGMDSGKFAILSKQIKDAILATDLSSYFKMRKELTPIVSRGIFDWSNEEHRSLGRYTLINSCNLSGSCKPFAVNKMIVDNLYTEYYRQGDIEKQAGLCPLSLMDREKQGSVPEDQLKYLCVIVLPCTELLKKILPNTEVLYIEADRLRQTWYDIIELRGQKSWRQDDSVVKRK